MTRICRSMSLAIASLALISAPALAEALRFQRGLHYRSERKDRRST